MGGIKIPSGPAMMLKTLGLDVGAIEKQIQDVGDVLKQGAAAMQRIDARLTAIEKRLDGIESALAIESVASEVMAGQLPSHQA